MFFFKIYCFLILSNKTFLYKLLSTKNLIATNTCLKQKAKNITTWEGTRKIGNKLIPIFNKIAYIIIPAKQKWRIIPAKSHNGIKTLSYHRLVKTAILNTKSYQMHSKSNSNKKTISEMDNQKHQLD